MGAKVYHQTGHCESWNIESFVEDQCGDGLIWSPVHQPVDRVRGFDVPLRRRSLWDPQYYLPNSPKSKLSSYPFFPEQIAQGFSTVNFLLLALDSARQCVQFQVEQEFEAIIIPSRFVDQMRTRFFEDHEEFSVRPFLSALSELGTTKPVYLTVPVTAAMLMDEGFRVKLLNWTTGFSELAGVYLLLSDSRATKQIQSDKLLFAYFQFVHELSKAGLIPLLGHLNTESILFSLFDKAILTFGAFENTRMFSLDKFIETDEQRRGPKARIYLPALLNWVRFEQAVQIRDDAPEVWESAYSPTSYAQAVLSAAAEPSFNQPGLYKHHFLCMAEQLGRLADMPLDARVQAIRSTLKQAIDLHTELQAEFIDLDRHGNGDHLQPWLDAVNMYYRRYLK